MQFKKICAVLAMGVVLTGCQTTNPYTGEQQTSRSTTYGIGGALAGAAIGAIADGGSGALKGAAIGGLAGAGYGHYTDQQEAKLRAELQGTGVQVYRRGNDLHLIMPADITFATSRYDIKSSFYPVLGSVAKVFKEFDKNLIEIEGYADSSGDLANNLKLSQDRANSVAKYLEYQGVSGTRITPIGRGIDNPIADNSTPEGRAKNRRVEINLRPVPQQR